jgi:hypothetical protein
MPQNISSPNNNHHSNRSNRMKLLTRILITSIVVTSSSGQREHRRTDQTNTADEINTISPTDNKHRRKKTTSVKVRRISQDDEYTSDAPWFFDKLAYGKSDSNYRHVSTEKSRPAIVDSSEVHNESTNQYSADVEDVHVEISIDHKSTAQSPNKESGLDQTETERELYSLLRRRGPRLGYGINRSKGGRDNADLVARVRGKVGKLGAKRGKIGTINWNSWLDDDDDWWGSGKSGEGMKRGKVGKINWDSRWDDDDDWWGSGKSGKSVKSGKGWRGYGKKILMLALSTTYTFVLLLKSYKFYLYFR